MYVRTRVATCRFYAHLGGVPKFARVSKGGVPEFARVSRGGAQICASDFEILPTPPPRLNYERSLRPFF